MQQQGQASRQRRRASCGGGVSLGASVGPTDRLHHQKGVVLLPSSNQKEKNKVAGPGWRARWGGRVGERGCGGGLQTAAGTEQVGQSSRLAPLGHPRTANTAVSVAPGRPPQTRSTAASWPHRPPRSGQKSGRTAPPSAAVTAGPQESTQDCQEAARGWAAAPRSRRWVTRPFPGGLGRAERR